MAQPHNQSDAAPKPKVPEDTAAVAAISAALVERWLNEYGDILWRFVLGRVRSREIAEDIFQESVLAAMQAHSLFGGRSSERTWLLGIAANKISDHFRALHRRTADGQVAALENSEAESADTSSMFSTQGMWAKPPAAWGLEGRDSLERAEALAALRRCINALPPSHAEAVWLRDLLNIPATQVCEALGISQTALWARMHRVRMSLRSCVEKSIGPGKERTR